MSALTGLKVLDFSKFLPGPYCTWMLGDLGADIIRVEHPRELAKQAKVFGWEKQSLSDQRLRRARDLFARNKKSVLLDPGAEENREAILALVKWADVLVEDYRPGVMEKMGLGYEDLKSVNPKLIYASLTLCGQTGPHRSKPGHDPIALAISGTLSRIGEDPATPQFPGMPVADLLTGSNGVIGILAAVIARQTSGEGQHVDIAMSDSAMALITTLVSRNADLEKLPPRGRRRTDSGIWKCRDGKFLVTTDMEPAYWRRMCEAVDLPQYADHQMNADMRDQIIADLAARYAQKDLAEWCEILEAANTQYMPVLSVAEAMEYPHNLERRMRVDIETEDGPVTQVGSPIKLSGTPAVDPTPAPLPGADNDAVFRALGISPPKA